MTTYTNVFGGNVVPPSEYSYAAVTLAANTTFEWPQLSTGTSLISQIMDVTASSASLTLTMPAANQVSTASPTLMRNVGANSFTVADNAGGVIITIAAGESRFIYITSNASAAGSWSTIAYGVGASAADAAALAGYGTKATGATLSTMIDTTLKTGDWTTATTDRAGLFVLTTGTYTNTLPTVASAGDDFYFAVKNAGDGTLTLAPQSGELIDGTTSLDFSPGESAYIVCSGAAWYTVGWGRSTLFQFTKLVKSVTGGGTITLTSAEASNKLIQFTGTLAANATINVPTVVAVYYLQNSYSGNYTLTIKTAGGTGVATAQDARSIVYCDGTDVVSAQTGSLPASTVIGGSAGAVLYQSATDVTAFMSVGTSGQIMLSGGTGAPTWTTNLTIAQGGTGATTAAGARTALGTTTESIAYSIALG